MWPRSPGPFFLLQGIRSRIDLAGGAQPGNQNAKKGRLFEQALLREIKQRDIKDGEGETLRRIASKLIDKADNGDIYAARELMDRLDGKPTQAHELSGPDGGAIPAKVEVVLVRPDSA
jgi:hypothetical protein